LLTNGRSALDPDAEVLVPGEQTTAHFLLNFYHPAALRKRFVPFDTLYDELCRTPGAQGVVIHEKRFTYARDGLTLLQDLGEHWEQETGCAIPLGAIAVRRSRGIAGAVAETIRQSLRWAEANEDEAIALCRQHAAEMRVDVIRAHISLYVTPFSYALGEEGEQAVRVFLSHLP
jgi:1,4-dihydroxy-6-naphthoate synthase